MGATTVRRGARSRAASFIFAGALLLLLALPAAAAALPPQFAWAWAQPYVWTPPVPGESDVPQFRCVAPGPSGSVYAASGSEADHWVIARVGSNGAQIWSTPPMLGPAGSLPTLSVLTSDAGRNAVAAGYAVHTGVSTSDVLMVKVSPSGAIRQMTWDGRAHKSDMASAVATDAGGNIYVTAMTTAANGLADAALLKFSPRGALKWKYIYASSKIDYFGSLALDKAGNIYVAGPADAMKNDSGALLVAKVSPAGRRIWQRKVRTADTIYDVAQVKLKGTSVYVGGIVITASDPVGAKGATSSAHPMVARLTTGGVVKSVYRKTTGPRMHSWGGMAVDPAGRAVVSISAQGYSATDPLLQTIVVSVISPRGKLYRQAVMDGTFDVATPREADVRATVVDAKGRIFCAGEIATGDMGETNAAVFSLPPVSSVSAAAWKADRVWRYDSPASGDSDEFLGLTIAGGRVYACGARTWPGEVPEKSQPIVERLSTRPADL